MNSKIVTGSHLAANRATNASPPVVQSSPKRKRTEVTEMSEKKTETSSSKFRKIAERVANKAGPSPDTPSKGHRLAEKTLLGPGPSTRFESISALQHLLPKDAESTAEMLRLAEHAFSAGRPYIVVRDGKDSPAIYRDASEVYTDMFYEQDTYYNVGTEAYAAWRGHVDQLEFLLFSGGNTHPVSLGSAFKMLDSGFSKMTMGLLLTAASPPQDTFENETKELIAFLNKINWFSAPTTNNESLLLSGMSETERRQAQVFLALNFASVDGSPLLVKLLDEGTPVNERDRHNDTLPLTVAIVNKAKMNVNLLLSRGADFYLDKDYFEDDDLFADEIKDLVQWAQEVADKRQVRN